ncbi:MFS transporter [Leeia sp. TBRC 13508]|uniref:MFS transporter n=1 Tax=Leeia speluncae TaxID=2884804 RepID=A0ABS8D454_9NEIS|nr:MFS transporter [Leeia speluncae]MCB6182957.1 MFS transporter [Leeia speluncae]
MSTPSPHARIGGIRLALGLSMLLASLGTSIVNIAQPTLIAAFHARFTEVQLVIIAYLASMTLATVLVGKLGDRYGLRPLQLSGLALFALASALCCMASHIYWLIAARTLQGIGATILLTLSMALMRQHAAPDQVGKAMGLLGTLSALGTALGPSIGGWMIVWQGWPGIFLVQIPLAVIAFVLGIYYLPTSSVQTTTFATERPNLRPLRHPLLANLIVAMVMMTTLIVGPFYHAIALGYPPAKIGMIMAIGPILSIISGIPAGQLVDRFGSTRVARWGHGLLILGSLLVASLPALLGISGYLIAIAVLTPGYQLFQAANNTHVLTDIPANQRGTVSGYLTLSRNVGLILGTSLMGKLFSVASGSSVLTTASAAAISQGMVLTFLVCCGMLVGLGVIKHTKG